MLGFSHSPRYLQGQLLALLTPTTALLPALSFHMDSGLCLRKPDPEADISGIGVRLAFYIQSVFLALLSACSLSWTQAHGALTTLVVTNIAYAITTIVLGFKPDSSLTLYDAMTVLSLLALSWFSILFALSNYNRFSCSDPFTKCLAILQSYMIFACAIVILVQGEGFGSQPECFTELSLLLFRRFDFGKGRLPALVLVVLTVVLYTWMTICDYWPNWWKRFLCFGGGKLDENESVKDEDKGQACKGVKPTRLMYIRENRALVGEDELWSFGQMLALCLAVVPVANTVSLYWKEGFGSRRRYTQTQQ